MKHSDTIDKIFEIYFSSVCSEPFSYKGRRFEPKRLIVSPLLLRGYTCPARCGACCGSFSLDYLPSEQAPPNALMRSIGIQDRAVSIMSDRQTDVPDRWCRNLDQSTGRCGIYDIRPMACDFELIRFLIYDDKVLLIQKQYGRAWAMQRIDTELGALCEMLPPSDDWISEVIRKLKRLQDWAEYFDIETRIGFILEWIASGHCSKPLQLDP